MQKSRVRHRSVQSRASQATRARRLGKLSTSAVHHLSNSKFCPIKRGQLNTHMLKPRPDRNIIVGFAWFDRAQWQRLMEVADDRNKLDDTFEQWERNALDG